MKKLVLIFLIFFIFISGIFTQSPVDLNNPSGKPEINQITVQKGKTLLDYIDLIFIDDIQTDIDPGIDPEGDFMFQPGFTTDGSKVLVPNGGTDNITVFDYESMEAEAIIDVGNYPCDIAITDSYAVVPCIFGDEIYVIDLSDYSIAATFTASFKP